MSPEYITLLSLIKTIVSGAHDVSLTKEVHWERVSEEASKQGVQGICFDALELLPAELVNFDSFCTINAPAPKFSA